MSNNNLRDLQSQSRTLTRDRDRDRNRNFKYHADHYISPTLSRSAPYVITMQNERVNIY